MKKLLGVALLGAALAGPVKAQDVMCIPGGDFVCAASQFTLSPGNTVLNFWVMNGATAATQNLASTLTRLAFWGLPDGVTTSFVSATFFNYDPVTLTQTSSNAAVWSGTAFSGQQFINVDQWAVAGGSNGASTCAGPHGAGNYRTCLADGGPIFSGTSDYLLFAFTITGSMDETDLAALGWGFHAQSIAAWQGDGYPGDSDSFQCASTIGSKQTGAGGANGFDKYCPENTPGDPQGVVPEPATMTLLATGLAGLAAARRRRKNNA